jgi:hypothetical protein
MIRNVIKILIKFMLINDCFRTDPQHFTPNSEKFIHLFMSDLLIFTFELLLIEFVKIEVTCVLLRVPMFPTENIFAAALNSSKAHLLLACPTSSFIILKELVRNFKSRNFGQ